MKIGGVLLLILTWITNINCSHRPFKFMDNSDQPAVSNAGVLLLIDDSHVETFFNHYRYIQTTGIKMTYFITKYHCLNSLKKTIIRQFYADGHEIAFHGTHHIRAAKYLQNHTIEEYINYEILPDLQLMQSEGYEIKDFSYPYASHTPELDSVLFNQFFYYIKLGFSHPTYYESQVSRGFVYTLAIENNYGIPTTQILNYLDSAKAHDKILMLSCHAIYDTTIVEGELPRLAVSFPRFKEIFDYAKAIGMRFYTLNDIREQDLGDKILRIEEIRYIATQDTIE